MPLDSRRVQKPVRKLRKLLKRMPKVPTPEDVHDLRTNTRRLEATLAALSLNSRRAERKLLKAMASIRRRAGKVRDLDVLTGYAATVRPNGEENCSVQLLEHLGAKRRVQAKKLHAVVVKKNASVRMALKRTSAELENLLCEDAGDHCDPNTAPVQATASALKLESELAKPARLTRNNLHPYRLKVKELQNVLRLAESADNQEFVNTLGAVKDAIGEWHDWEELLVIAREVLDHGARCRLLHDIQPICEQKYKYALAEAEKMREKYLGLSSRKTKRKTTGGIQHPTEPVWAATAAIAA